jgi:hypothetical protein
LDRKGQDRYRPAGYRRRAPVPFHLPGIGVEHGHAFIAIAVGDIGLVGFGVDPDLGDPAEILAVVAAGTAAGAADLHEKLSVFGELQNMGVGLAIAANPHIALVVDMNTVIGSRPFISLARTAPG